MFGPCGLSRQERELLAVVVSRAQRLSLLNPRPCRRPPCRGRRRRARGARRARLPPGRPGGAGAGALRLRGQAHARPRLGGRRRRGRAARARLGRRRHPRRDPGDRLLQLHQPHRRRRRDRSPNPNGKRSDDGGLHDRAHRRLRAAVPEVGARPQVARPAVLRDERRRAASGRDDPRAQRGRERPGGGVHRPLRRADDGDRRRGPPGAGRTFAGSTPSRSGRS